MRRNSAAMLPFDKRTEHVDFTEELRLFEWRKGSATAVTRFHVADSGDGSRDVPIFTNEFWTAKQRAAHSLHEISYRACFKPQLPRFFIERLTRPGDIVYDPFMGRGTTLVEAALLDRVPYGCDVNPLSRVLCEPRLQPPAPSEVARALEAVDFMDADAAPDELLVFYHPDTLRQISALRKHLRAREADGRMTDADRWIRMVAVNRLTGHSNGFFSVYTMPPNQAVSARVQAKINARLNQAPPPRDVATIILKKSRGLLADLGASAHTGLRSIAGRSRLLVGSSSATPGIESESVALVVTSPPFLDVVNYQGDNWLRCWFCGIDPASVPVTMARGTGEWKAFVARTLVELRRVLRPGGYVAFEVGEVKGGALRLEELVIPAGMAAGLAPVLVLVNAQQFTKTANCWGVTNNAKGTNTNRVVLFQKPN
jgi:DNA modification methylase